MTALTTPFASASRTRSQVARAAPGIAAAVLLVGWPIVLIASGSTADDVLRWVAAVLVGVLAPGFVVVRVSRAAPAPLIEDLGWASAAGCLVALFGWFWDRVLPWSPGAYSFGILVTAFALLIPSARRRVLARPAPGWGPGPSLALGATVLVSYVWMLAAGLLAYPSTPAADGTLYYQDEIYQLSLVGELRHTLLPTYAPVAGTPMHYHWFLYAITAHLVQGTGVDPFDAIMRLGPAALVPAVLVLTAVVARRMAGLVWAGPVAAGLLGVVDVSVATGHSYADGTAGILQEYWILSQTQTLGWLAGIAAIGCVFAFVRRGPADAAVPVALLVPLLILTAGAKSSQLPVLIAGISVALVAQVVRRDGRCLRRSLGALALALAVFAAATVVIYGLNSNGMRVQLWGRANSSAVAMFPAFVTRGGGNYLAAPSLPLLALVTAVALFVLPLLPRLLGLFFQLRYRAADPSGWICFGAALAGLVLPFMFQHPGWSQIYFLESAYPIGVIGAASGLALAGRQACRALGSKVQRRRFVVWLAVLLVVGCFAAALCAHLQPRLNPVQRSVAGHPGDPTASGVSLLRMAWLWWRPTIVLLAVLAVLVVGAAAVVRTRLPDRGAHPAPLVWLSAMCLLLGTGLFGLSQHFGGTDTPAVGSVADARAADPHSASGPLPTMPDQPAAGRYVDAHAGPDDVVATNIFCRSGFRPGQTPAMPCDARDFTASAFTQRRTLVGAWTYSDRVTDEAWRSPLRYVYEPFWDPDLLNREIAACDQPTAALLAGLYRDDHVRWVYVDLRQSPVDVAALDRLAVRRFLGRTAAVWQLKRPAA